MGKVKVINFSVSLDGFGAGLNQDLENPIGIRGRELHNWMYPTKTFMKMTGREGGTEGIDNETIAQAFHNVGAWILGRNMFGPIRGDWPDDTWKGWWGEEPPYHVPVFVLTNYARAPLEMKGGTTFYFVTTGIKDALDQARKSANGKDIRIGGGASTIRQFLQAGYIDEMQLSFSPIFLGSGEHLFTGIDLPSLGFTHVQSKQGEGAVHITLTKK